jgi:purine-binding chemotaxis protein CheW
MDSSVTPRNKRLSIIANKYLTFTLGNGFYAVPALKVREVIRMLNITAIPRMPEYVRGVINLRGKTIPVVDLRMRFGLPNPEVTNHTSILVVQVAHSTGLPVFVGIVVDAVEEVINISREEVEDPTAAEARIDPSCILGTARIRGANKILLDIDQVLSREIVPFTALQTGTLPPADGQLPAE